MADHNIPWKIVSDIKQELDSWTGEYKDYLAGYNIEDSKGNEIVGCEGIIPGPNSLAEARLIAAAPSLLKAVELALPILLLYQYEDNKPYAAAIKALAEADLPDGKSDD